MEYGDFKAVRWQDGSYDGQRKCIMCASRLCKFPVYPEKYRTVYKSRAAKEWDQLNTCGGVPEKFMQEAMTLMTEAQKEAWLLTMKENLSTRQAGSKLGVSHIAVIQRLKAAKKKVHDYFTQEQVAKRLELENSELDDVLYNEEKDGPAD